jgi:F-type H+-transporting ATPase subunit epsilon
VQPGIVKVRMEEGEDYISVSGGFLEVRPDRITLLADAAETSATLDVERAQRAKQRAEERLAKRGEGIDIARAEAARARALRRLEMLELSNASGNVFEKVLSKSASQ